MAVTLRPLAAESVHASFPFVFHPTRWSQTLSLVDELMIRWHDLPLDAHAELVLSNVAPETVVSLRNLRHAPGTVRSHADGSLQLRVGGVSFVPLPPVPTSRIAALLKITLPAHVKAGQRFQVDVLHLRRGAVVQNGAIRVAIRVAKAAEFVGKVQRGVGLLQAQLSLTAPTDRWHPILARRLSTERARARALSERAGVPWHDPTVYPGPGGQPQPVVGSKVRVVLEHLRILHADEHFWRHKLDLAFYSHVHSDDNGGQDQRQRFPAHGHYVVRAGAVIELNQVVFEGYVEQHLAIAVGAMEHHLLEADETLGRYVRVFHAPVATFLGRYRPGDERIDPEEVGAWTLQYRVEAG